MRFLASLEQGIHADIDDYANIHPDLLSQYYGVENPTHMVQSYSSNDNGEQHFLEDLEAQIDVDQQTNVQHDAIKAAHYQNPFVSDVVEQCWWDAFLEVQRKNIIPSNMMLTVEEWVQEGFDGYPSHWEILVGIHTMKLVTVSLPVEVWYDRALAWAQALTLLGHFDL